MPEGVSPSDPWICLKLLGCWMCHSLPRLCHTLTACAAPAKHTQGLSALLGFPPALPDWCQFAAGTPTAGIHGGTESIAQDRGGSRLWPGEFGGNLVLVMRGWPSDIGTPGIRRCWSRCCSHPHPKGSSRVRPLLLPCPGLWAPPVSSPALQAPA